MTPEQFGQLSDLNAQVNAEFAYCAVPGPTEEPDWWTDQYVPGNSFCCRDYVLIKAERLQALGWPQHAMTVVLCYTEPVDGARQYHAALAVQPDGDPEPVILDSQFPQAYLKSQCPADYVWERRQIAGSVDFMPFA